MSETQYRKLSADEIKDNLVQISGWQLVDGKLQKEFEFNDFVQAFGFMTQVAMAAERLNHHPEWYNVYSKLRISLVTHDLDGISNYDFKLAKLINDFEKRIARDN